MQARTCIFFRGRYYLHMTKRKRKPEDVIPTIYVRVTPELKAAVEARAEEERRTEKQIVTAALRLYLDAEVTP